MNASMNAIMIENTMKHAMMTKNTVATVMPISRTTVAIDAIQSKNSPMNSAIMKACRITTQGHPYCCGEFIHQKNRWECSQGTDFFISTEAKDYVFL